MARRSARRQERTERPEGVHVPNFREIVEAFPILAEEYETFPAPVIPFQTRQAPTLSDLLKAGAKKATIAGRHKDAAAISAVGTVLEEVRIALANATPAAEHDAPLYDALTALNDRLRR